MVVYVCKLCTQGFIRAVLSHVAGYAHKKKKKWTKILVNLDKHYVMFMASIKGLFAVLKTNCDFINPDQLDAIHLLLCDIILA